MKIALISCGRSDFSIYLPLIRRLNADPFFDLDIIAFGTHVSRFYDRTVDLFLKEGFEVAFEIESLVLGDSPEAISSGMGLTIIKFSSIWAQEEYDVVIVLGDRFEMFAAIAATVPFNIPVAHLHGGETTLGAIDDKFRHAITSMSRLHFATTENHANRIEQIIGTRAGVYNVGAPALDNLGELKLLTKDEFLKRWNIDLSKPTVLVTYHPETVAVDRNIHQVRELLLAMDQINRQFVITMPNNDTMGTAVRQEIMEHTAAKNEKYKTVEVLGAVGYYSCMNHCDFLLGNTSSGIIEAASFKKYVINVGDRQKGREAGPNVFHALADRSAILKAVGYLGSLPPYDGGNPYGRGNASEAITKVLKEFHEQSSN